MNVIIFGATGMVGQVLRESLLDPDVEIVQTVRRTATEAPHRKLRAIVHSDLWHYEAIEANLSGFDACFFLSWCLRQRNERGGIQTHHLRNHNRGCGCPVPA
jgi:putative NADH-flavin reductase